MVTRAKAKKQKQKLVEQYGPYCWWCGCVLPPDKLTFEHMLPKSHGGSNSLENLRLACLGCNRSRGNSLYPPGWRPNPN